MKPAPTSPLVSPDGKFYWDGTRWVPIRQSGRLGLLWWHFVPILAVAAVAAGLLLLGSLMLPRANPIIPAAPASPLVTAPSATELSAECAIRHGENDATVVFIGYEATTMCSNWQRVSGYWHDLEPIPSLSSLRLICTDSYGGLSWEVWDSGGAMYGGAACRGLNQYAHGGTLTIP